MQQYLNLLRYTLENGRRKNDRTGTGTISVFGAQKRYGLTDADYNNVLPVVTTKKVFLKGVIEELLWMIRGEININSLKEKGVNIWNEWADKHGDLGPVYGAMWREFPGRNNWTGDGDDIDQIALLEEGLRENPESRRHIVSGWHPALLPDTSMSPSDNAYEGRQALPPCHTMVQFICEPMTLAERAKWLEENPPHIASILIDDVPIESMSEEHGLAERAHTALSEEGVPRYFLSSQLYQRSGDLFLGVPFNIASYALLTHMLAKTNNMVPKEFVHTLGDAHIYTNHIEQVKEQLSREPLCSPSVHIHGEQTSILDITSDDIEVADYEHHPAIKAEVAV